MLLQFVIEGNLASQPRLATTKSGHPVCVVRVLHNSRYRKGDQWVEGKTVSVDLAERVAGLNKGDTIIAELADDLYIDTTGGYPALQAAARTVAVSMRWHAATSHRGAPQPQDGDAWTSEVPVTGGYSTGSQVQSEHAELAAGDPVTVWTTPRGPAPTSPRGRAPHRLLGGRRGLWAPSSSWTCLAAVDGTVQAGHQVAVGCPRGPELLAVIGELLAQGDGVPLEFADAAAQGLDVGGCAQPGGLPGRLAQGFGQATFQSGDGLRLTGAAGLQIDQVGVQGFAADGGVPGRRSAWWTATCPRTMTCGPSSSSRSPPRWRAGWCGRCWGPATTATIPAGRCGPRNGTRRSRAGNWTPSPTPTAASCCVR